MIAVLSTRWLVFRSCRSSSSSSGPVGRFAQIPAPFDYRNAHLEACRRGMTNPRIARQVHLSPCTVKYHVSALAQQFGATNRVTLSPRCGQLRLQ